MQKKGISLIVLVITIIVMIILAATVVISLTSSSVIDRANQAVQLTDEKQVQDLAVLTWAEAYMNGIKDQFILETKVNERLRASGVNINTYNLLVSPTGINISKKLVELNEYEFYFNVEYICNGFNPGDGNIGNSKVVLTENGVIVEHIITNHTKAEGSSDSGHDFFGYTWYHIESIKYNQVHKGKASFDADANVYYDENGLYHARFEYTGIDYSNKKASIGDNTLTFVFSEDGKSFNVLGQTFIAKIS